VDVQSGHNHVEAIPRILVGAYREYFNDPQTLSILVVAVLPDDDLEDLAHRFIGHTEVRARVPLSLAQGTQLVTNPDVRVVGEGHEHASETATHAYYVHIAGRFTVCFKLCYTAIQQALRTARQPDGGRARKQE
jgi:hypothetical protein